MLPKILPPSQAAIGLSVRLLGTGLIFAVCKRHKQAYEGIINVLTQTQTQMQNLIELNQINIEITYTKSVKLPHYTFAKTREGTTASAEHNVITQLFL
jgi:hypothetical protein